MCAWTLLCLKVNDKPLTTSAQDLFPRLKGRTTDCFSLSHIMCFINLENSSHCNTTTHPSEQIKRGNEAYVLLYSWEVAGQIECHAYETKRNLAYLLLGFSKHLTSFATFPANNRYFIHKEKEKPPSVLWEIHVYLKGSQKGKYEMEPVLILQDLLSQSVNSVCNTDEESWVFLLIHTLPHWKSQKELPMAWHYNVPIGNH